MFENSFHENIISHVRILDVELMRLSNIKAVDVGELMTRNTFIVNWNSIPNLFAFLTPLSLTRVLYNKITSRRGTKIDG